MKFLKRYWPLIIILILAACLRLYRFGSVPPSPDWDETAIGYNAYSIIRTGRDEYGKFLPMVFRSFDDYKPPLYIYLTIPSVYIFGLNTFAVRFPSFAAGMISVLGIYILLKEILALDKEGKGNRNRKLDELIAKYGPLLAAFLFAISPWDIHYSHIGFETHVGMAMNIWGAIAFLKGRKSAVWLSLSAFIFGLTLYVYQSERVFAPLLVLLLCIVVWKDLWKNRRAVYIAVGVGIITIIPLFLTFLDPNTLMRMKGTSVFADQTGLLSRTIAKLQDDTIRGDKIGMLFDNRRIVWFKTVFDGYLSEFSFKWLFLTGDLSRHHPPGMGLLYLWDLPFLLLGLREVFRRGGKLSVIIFGWFLIAPIAAAPTTGLPHATRTLAFLPTFQLFITFGILWFVAWMIGWKENGNRRIRTWLNYLIIAILSLGLIANMTYFLRMYFLETDREYSQDWQYGYQQAVEYTEAHKGAYERVIVSTKLEQPHMFFLFYTKYDPRTYLAAGGTASGGFLEVRNHFDKYEFRPIHWQTEKRDGSELYVGTPNEIPAGDGLTVVRYLNGDPAMVIADR